MKIRYAILLVLCQASCTKPAPLTKTYISPLNGYSQIVAVSRGDITTLYISGQVGTGDTFEAQLRSALANMQTHLAEAGATLDDLVKINTYIVDYVPAHLDSFRQVRREVMGNTDMPASTLVGVQALGLPEWKIEIEGVAVVEE